ncbi:hypothetical protein [Mucilaginibacter pedocola]|uniref:Uncharacterized protein n=1 Tax=Mucilaginibacter pedocola TaxID=1792845 RepID=A0A1S9PHL3_9SPHI|nr:hypothetical protein [Mucilaginibacter pedocola]OOQ60409.1 hypothetical protein BC343_25690 [Mucilaginibacter pedocola]
MPGETGLCYIISDNGCFKGYIARRKNGTYRHMGNGYYTDQALATIALHLTGNVRLQHTLTPFSYICFPFRTQ